MRYPLNKTATVAAWMSVLDNPGATDEEFAGAVVDLVNTAYYAGVNAGFSRGGGGGYEPSPQDDRSTGRA